MNPALHDQAPRDTAVEHDPCMPGALGANVRVDELLALVPHPGAADDVLVSVEGSGHGVALFDGGRHTLRWSAGSFSGYVRREDVGTDATRVFVVDNPRLTALSMKDAAEAVASSAADRAELRGLLALFR